MTNYNMLNTREARAEREDKELEDLLANQNPNKVDDREEDKEGFSDNTNKKEDNWETRYSELRSWSQKNENKLKKDLEDLKKQISKPKPPSDPEEFQRWMNEFPDAVRQIKTLIQNETGGNVTGDVDTLKTEIEELKYELRREKAFSNLAKKHSDWMSVVNDSNFIGWLEDQRSTRGKVGQAMWEAINTDDFDINAASNVISEFKQKTKRNTEAPKRDTRDAAFSVAPARTSAPTANADGKRLFSEDEIEAMSQREYEKLEDEINLALREGRVVSRRAGAAL